MTYIIFCRLQNQLLSFYLENHQKKYYHLLVNKGEIMTLLQLQDLTYRYKNTAEAVLYKINYDFEPGKFYSIIGESGAGKSTLLSLLAGLNSTFYWAIKSC